MLVVFDLGSTWRSFCVGWLSMKRWRTWRRGSSQWCRDKSGTLRSLNRESGVLKESYRTGWKRWPIFSWNESIQRSEADKCHSLLAVNMHERCHHKLWRTDPGDNRGDGFHRTQSSNRTSGFCNLAVFQSMKFWVCLNFLCCVQIVRGGGRNWAKFLLNKCTVGRTGFAAVRLKHGTTNHYYRLLLMNLKLCWSLVLCPEHGNISCLSRLVDSTDVQSTQLWVHSAHL